MAELKLKGDTYSLEMLVRNFQDKECCIYTVKFGNYIEYRLKSDFLSSISEENEIIKHGKYLTKYVNTITSFVKTNYTPIDFDTYYIGDACYSFGSFDLCLEYDGCFIDSNGQQIDFDYNLMTTLKKYYDDELLQEVLSLYFEKGETWVNLYRIYEVFKKHNISPSKKLWISEEQERTFKHTANSPEVLGFDARHAKQSGKPPKNPMSCEVAIAIIRLIIMKYLEEKAV